MKQLDVTIMGQSYVLACPEGGEAGLRAAVAQVDREMSVIREKGKVKSRERIAVLAALNLAYALAGRPPARVAATAAGAESTGADIDVDALIRRLDRALGADGQLL